MPNTQNDGKGGGSESAISRVVNGKWDCNVCGTEGNWATRARCRNCTAYGPRGAGGGGKGGGGKTSGFGKGGGQRYWSNGASVGGGASSGGGGGGASTTFAQMQVQRQQADQRLQTQRDDSKKREEALRAANQRLVRELNAAKAGHKPREDDDEIDDEDDNESEEKRQEKIDATQKAIPYLVLLYGEESEQVGKARGDIESLQRASREAKPYKTYRGKLERKLETLQRREEEDEVLIEVERAQERLNKIRVSIAEREKGIAAVDEELKELLRKAIAEGEPSDPSQPPAAVDPNTAWDTINSTLGTLAAQPGVPQGVAVQLGGLLEQIRVAALALRQHAAMLPNAAEPAQQAATGSTTTTTAATSNSSSITSSTPSLPTPASTSPTAAVPSTQAS